MLAPTIREPDNQACAATQLYDEDDALSEDEEEHGDGAPSSNIPTSACFLPDDEVADDEMDNDDDDDADNEVDFGSRHDEPLPLEETTGLERIAEDAFESIISAEDSGPRRVPEEALIDQSPPPAAAVEANDKDRLIANDEEEEEEENNAMNEKEEGDLVAAGVLEYRNSKKKGEEELEEEAAEKRRKAVSEALEADRKAALEAAEARRSRLGERLKEVIANEEARNERAAQSKLKALAEEDSDGDDSIEIIGAPTRIKTPTRKTLRAQLRNRVVRQGIERFAAAASVDRCRPDDYIKRLEALEAQRFLELRGHHKRLQEEQDLLESVLRKQRERQERDRLQDLDEEEEALFGDEEEIDKVLVEGQDDEISVGEGVKELFAEEAEEAEGSVPPVAVLDEHSKSVAVEPTPEATDDEGDEESEAEAPPAADRNAAYRAMLMKEAETARNRRPTDGIEDEAEESEDENEDHQRGLGDFGFGIASTKEDDGAARDDIVPTEEDLEAIVDELAPNERGDDSKAEDLRKRQEAMREKQQMAEMLRNVREGFDGRGRGEARGAVSMKDLVGFDAAANLEAKRLGLADDEDDDEQEDKEILPEQDDEAGLAELISRELKARHLGPARQNVYDEDDIVSSDDEDDDASVVKNTLEDDDDDDSDVEEQRMALRAKHWAKRAKMRRVLTEASHREQQQLDRPESQEELTRQILDADENSHLIRGMLARTSSVPAPLARSSSLGRSLSLGDSQSSSLGAGVSKAARDALMTRCGSFFSTLERSDSLLADDSQQKKATTASTKQISSSASGRHVASRKCALFFDSNSTMMMAANSNSATAGGGGGGDESNRGLKRRAPLQDVSNNNINNNKRFQYDPTASIWANVAKNRFGARQKN